MEFDAAHADARLAIAGFADVVEIGRGGFATVYRARQLRFDRIVAIKVMHQQVADERQQHRFRKECAATGRLSNHPNVVTLYDSGFNEHDEPFLVAEYMEGGSLSAKVRREGPVPVDEMLSIGVLIAGALETAHRNGIMHRDVKPQNVLLSAAGEPALSDFGIAALGGLESTMTQSEYTPVHTAPELLEGERATPRSDVYSLASTLYTLLAGKNAFATQKDEGLMQLLRRIANDPPPRIERPDVPAAVEEAIGQAMAKRPDDRPDTALAFAQQLRELRHELGLRDVAPHVDGAASHGRVVDPQAHDELVERVPFTAARVSPRAPSYEPDLGAVASGPPAPRTVRARLHRFTVVAGVALAAAGTALAIGATIAALAADPPEDPPPDVLPANGPVADETTLVITPGDLDHGHEVETGIVRINLSLDDPDPESHSLVFENNDAHAEPLEVGPGNPTDTTRAFFGQSGKYTIHCTEPGHEEEARVRVNGRRIGYEDALRETDPSS